MPETMTVVMLAGGGAGLLVIAAAGLLAREASYRALARHVHRVVRVDTAGEIEPTQDTGKFLLGAIQRFGETLRSSALFSEGNLAELERTALAAGLAPGRTASVVIGGKVLLIVAGPTVAFTLATFVGYSVGARVMLATLATAIGMFGPNWVLNWLRRSHVTALRRGLPDALDLLVVCAEAGLGLESAIDRVAVEMRPSSRAVALEFSTLAQELRMSSDRRGALMRMGERMGLESFQRLMGTLSQTLRYGTPLGQALRILASEMRNERLLRLEEKAAKLPALLTLPLMLFILPCLFIVLAGPAAIRVFNLFAH